MECKVNPINQNHDSGIITDIEPDSTILLTKINNVENEPMSREESGDILNGNATEKVQIGLEQSNNAENENSFEDKVENQTYSDNEDTNTITKKTRKKVTRIDSDSEDDNEVVTREKENSSSDKENEAVIYTMNSKGEVVPEENSNSMKSRLATLCDSDSEDETVENPSEQTEVIEQTVHENKKKPSKKQVKTIGESKPMNAKEAADQRIEIQSESQRMLRERNVSLPYHKPKPRSLKEFLARRPKLAPAIPGVGKAPPSVAIKMSTEQLELISKQLKEREKVVKEFYKSESEGEDDNDDDKDYVPPTDLEPESTEKNQESNNSQEVMEESCILQDMNDSNITEEHESNSNHVSTNEIPIDTNKILVNTNETPCKENIATKDTNDDTSTDTTNLNNSDNYNFSLDDVESPEKIPQTETKNDGDTVNSETLEQSAEPSTKKSSRDFAFTELDQEIEAFGEEKQQEDENISPPKSKIELLKEKLANIQPKLSGDPDHVIDLDSGITKPTEVVQLMERFAKHTSIKKHLPKHKVELSIVTVETGGDVHKETVAMNVSDDEDTAPEEKPGARLLKLKEDLQNQMALRKSEIWQQKASKGLKINGEIEHSEENPDQKDILDDEDEEEMDFTDEEEYSDEEMYDEELLKDKPRKKSAFMDDEAEVSGNEDEEEADVKEGYEDEVPDEEVTGDEEAETSNDVPDTNDNEPQKKVLRRIVQLEDDSDDEESFENPVSALKTTSNDQLDSTITGDEDDLIPPHQLRQLKTPIKTAMSQTKSITDFLTPISFLTSIQNLASASKSKDTPARGSTTDSPVNIDMIQKKLFNDSESVTSQATQASTSETTPTIKSPTAFTEEPPNTQDLLGICSGEFTGVTQPEPSIIPSYITSESQEIKTLGSDQDMIISQLLDEEELENFKKKFDSPPNASQQSSVEAQEIIGGGIIDSDDEESGVTALSSKKKHKRKIHFSDDDDSDDDNSPTNNEEINLHDEDSEDTREENVDNIGYDSEENEIDLNQETVKKPMKLRTSDFFEAEAELSESEWGSEDEDEKGLDRLEFELGDTEKFDEDQVKEDLEKIHMRRMLDDDTREVKMLQEILLDDGELHGTGRQRQFKWKNIDETDDASEEKTNDEEIYMEEEESEEQWRKRRHEREMFLKEKLKKNQELQDDLLNQSQLLKMGKKVLEKCQSQNNSQNNTPKEKSDPELENGGIKTPFNLLTKRGSFLSRSDQVLQRVAEYTKSCTEITTGSSKTTKNFVFQSVSALEVSVAAVQSKKRKATEGTPNVLKKLRLNSSFSPALKKKLDKSQRSKKLFNF